MNLEHRQSNYQVRFDWGLDGATAVAKEADVAVIVDVLSFTTTLSVAVDAGIEVFPYPVADSAAEYATRRDAAVAVRRSRAMPGDVSLSPASIRSTGATLRRLVLPSPNGSTISHALGEASRVCVGASLRNAQAVAAWILAEVGSDSVVAVIAAGERWPGGTLRPAVEDLWGAGAVISTLIEEGCEASVEAEVAAAGWHAVQSDVASALRRCGSGRELAAAGYECDVDVAAEIDRSAAVPVLQGESFVDIRWSAGQPNSTPCARGSSSE